MVIRGRSHSHLDPSKHRCYATGAERQKGLAMTSKKSSVTPAFLQAFQQDAEKAQGELQASQRFTPIYFRASKRKQANGQPMGVIEVVNPMIRDDKNRSKIDAYPELSVVIMNHAMLREMKYMGADGKMHVECVSVGPKKSGVGIGTLHAGPMACLECAALYPEGWGRNVIEYGSDQVSRKNVKCSARYSITALLPEEARVDGESPLAMAFLPMTSTYGILIKNDADAAERSKTLLAYPEKSDPEGHKGILHKLLTRPWKTGQKYGLDTNGTPHTAIKVIVRSEWLGDTTEPVLSFEIGEELDEAGLQAVQELREQATAITHGHIEQMVKDAYPAIAANTNKRLADAATSADWGDFAAGVRLALPVHAEVMPEEAPVVEEPVQASVVKPSTPKGPPPAPDFKEFPEELPEDLPFSEALGY